VDERGFIAKKQQSTNYAQKSTQTFNKGNVQQQSAPASAPLQQVSRTSTSSVAPMQSVSTSVKTHTPSKEETKAVSRAVDAFDGLSNELKKYWVGSDNDRNSLCKAFQRPYVKGFDNTKPKNAILVLGAESRGKVYAVRCITELLKEKKVFRYAPIATIDMVDYVADSSNALFLSDLFKALNTNTETVVFENIDKASLGQLDIIYQLLTEGTYKLSKRYMVNNGSLVEATGILNTELVSEIATNGKFFCYDIGSFSVKDYFYFRK
jgi:hypothetical protein